MLVYVQAQFYYYINYVFIMSLELYSANILTMVWPFKCQNKNAYYKSLACISVKVAILRNDGHLGFHPKYWSFEKSEIYICFDPCILNRVSIFGPHLD